VPRQATQAGSQARESDKLSQLSADRRNAVGFRLAEPLRAEINESREETARRGWATLTPEFLGLPSLAMAAGFVGAMAVSAIVALIVVKVVYPPSISTANEERVAESTSLSTTPLEDLAKVSEAQAKMEPADEPVPAETLLADAPPPKETAAPKPPAPIQQLAKAEAGPPWGARPRSGNRASAAPAVPPAPPTATAAPEPRRSISLSQDEIAFLLKRGQALFAVGDIASARLILTRIADTGSAEAAFTLASTFDASVLASLHIVGVQAIPKWHAPGTQKQPNSDRWRQTSVCRRCASG
jgi:cytoskeletal protein RodZ